VPTNTFQLKNAKAKKTVARNMSTDAFIHASIITWAIANMDSVAIFLTLSEDKSIDLNHRNKPAKSCIMKTTVLLDQSADFHMILESIHAFTTPFLNANSQMLTVDIHMKKSLMFQLFVFLTSWAGAPTTKIAKMPTISTT